LDVNAGGAMYHCVREYIPTPLVVELGSWKGRSTAWIAQALVDRGGGKVVAVDTWAGSSAEHEHLRLTLGYGPDTLYEEFLANMERLGLRDTVEPWRMTTDEAAAKWPHDQRIGLLYIDANHEYAQVRTDFEKVVAARRTRWLHRVRRRADLEGPDPARDRAPALVSILRSRRPTSTTCKRCRPRCAASGGSYRFRTAAAAARDGGATSLPARSD
jgi:hypothetical protein